MMLSVFLERIRPVSHSVCGRRPLVSCIRAGASQRSNIMSFDPFGFAAGVSPWLARGHLIDRPVPLSS